MSAPHPSSKPIPATAGLGFAALLGTAWMLLSYGRLAWDTATPAFKDPRIIAQTLAEPIWQSRLGLNIALFVLALLLLHLTFGVACWLMARLGELAWPRTGATRRQWILGWFLLGVAWLLVANASRFPRSSLGAPYRAISEVSFHGIAVDGLFTTCLGAAIALTILVAMIRALGLRWVGALLGGTAIVAVSTGFLQPPGPTQVATAQRPNIILLGVDSLRPDMVTRECAPHIRAFLDQSLQLSDAVTPLARTFPAWVSILTGRHPHTTGAVMNLLPRELIHTGPTLPELLRQNGYRTVYAIDETRFSNLDSSYGFDATAMPTIGSSDFLLAWFADTPLSNVMMNTRLGALLFPHVHANRAASTTYDPDSFVRRIGRQLGSSKPLFLAAHLTLPHWPLEWATPGDLPADMDGSRAMYAAAVRRADRQFGDLLVILERRGLLANAVVITLSDHGEAFGPDDGFLAQAFHSQEPASASEQHGHGNSVFSPPQYQVVLGFRAYGDTSSLLPTPNLFSEPASLLDVTPTILDLLQIRSEKPFDGVSLLPLFRRKPGASDQLADRIRYTESEYNPKGFSPDSLSPSALAEAARIYRIDASTDRLQVRSDMLGWIMSTRQYGALLGNRAIGAAVPGLREDGEYEFVYAPLIQTLDAPIRTGDSAIAESDSSRLRQALQDRFGIEIPNS